MQQFANAAAHYGPIIKTNDDLILVRRSKLVGVMELRLLKYQTSNVYLPLQSCRYWFCQR